MAQCSTPSEVFLLVDIISPDAQKKWIYLFHLLAVAVNSQFQQPQYHNFKEETSSFKQTFVCRWYDWIYQSYIWAQNLACGNKFCTKSERYPCSRMKEKRCTRDLFLFSSSATHPTCSAAFLSSNITLCHAYFDSFWTHKLSAVENAKSLHKLWHAWYVHNSCSPSFLYIITFAKNLLTLYEYNYGWKILWIAF